MVYAREFASGSVSVYDDEFMRLQSTQWLSECDLDLDSFANDLILLRDGYLQFSTDFQMTRRNINSILWHVVHAWTSSQCVIVIVILCAFMYLMYDSYNK